MIQLKWFDFKSDRTIQVARIDWLLLYVAEQWSPAGQPRTCEAGCLLPSPVPGRSDHVIFVELEKELPANTLNDLEQAKKIALTRGREYIEQMAEKLKTIEADNG